MPNITYVIRYIACRLPWWARSMETFSAGSTMFGDFTKRRKYGMAATKARATYSAAQPPIFCCREPPPIDVLIMDLLFKIALPLLGRAR